MSEHVEGISSLQRPVPHVLLDESQDVEFLQELGRLVQESWSDYVAGARELGPTDTS